MIRPLRHLRTPSFALATAVALVLVAVWCDAAFGCPTCKDNLAHDPNGANLARGYFYSILFMLSMPPLIFSSLCLYFWWEIRRARGRQGAAPPAEPAWPQTAGSSS